jgi:DNA-binding transcriptional regulator LsrR (DeoR family)
MYYEEGLNQATISEKLGISKSSISRILNAAKENGIVQINVHNPLPSTVIAFEKELERTFGLKEAIVVEVASEDPKEIKMALAKEAANYLERVIKDGDLIGVTWGTTLREIAQFVENTKKNDVMFIPMLGGLGQSQIDIHANHIALDLARKFRAESKMLHAPFIVDDIQRKKMLIEDRTMQDFFEMFDHLDISVTGIGSPSINSPTMLASGCYTTDDLRKLYDAGATADISSLIIDENGKGDQFEINQRIIGITLEQIKRIPLTIGVSGHEDKAEAILATLIGGYLEVLITDARTAEKVISVYHEKYGK